VLYAKTEVNDHGLSQFNSIAVDQTQRLHIGVPAIKLIKAATWDDKWKSFQGGQASLRVGNFLHGHG
jgi:hypothetical protein